MGIFERTRNLATLWYERQKFRLRGEPQTQIDSGGTINKASFSGQEISRGDLKKVKKIRESGGLVAWLFEAKSLMKFGTGAELQAEDDAVQEFLDDNFEDVDLTVLELGQDAIWYPYGLGEIVETRGGRFSHIELIEPWTMLPMTDELGRIRYWEQETQNARGTQQRFEPNQIGRIVLNKSSGRDKVGVSEVLRNEEEIMQYRENQQAVNKAIEIAGFPHHVWTVGSEGRSPINDNDLRRVRNLVDDMDGDTQFVVGPDVNHDKITPSAFDFGAVTKRDLRMLTTAVGLPMEIAGYGREGLGSGSEAALIKEMLALQNEVSRRRFETMFISEFVHPVIDEYSNFSSSDVNISLQIDPFLDGKDGMADLINKVGEYMSNEEIRNKLDLPPLEDEELAESYRSPEAVEKAEEEDQPEQPVGGLFKDSARDAVSQELDRRGLSATQWRQLQDSYTDYPDAASENAQMALNAREDTGNPNDCGTDVGWARANQLADREPISKETIARMSNFARHQDNSEMSDEEGRADCGWMMWKAWGGDEGIEWAERKLDELEGEEDRENARGSGN